MQDYSTKGHYPSEDELLALMRELRVLDKVSVDIGKKPHTLERWLAVRPELKAKMYAAGKGTEDPNRKLCTKCLLVIPLEDFEADSRYKTGRRSQCKQCRNMRQRNTRRRNATSRVRSTTPSFTEDQKAEIVRCWLAGETQASLARRFACKQPVIRMVINDAGYVTKRMAPWRYKRVSQDISHEMKERYEAGDSLNSLAKTYSLSRECVERTLRQAAVTIRRGQFKRVFSKEELELIDLMWRQGSSLQAIANATGNISATPALKRALSELGFSFEPRNKGINSPHWKGGTRTNGQGYRETRVGPEHPYACMRKQGGMVAEHRLVMAEFLGRPLASWETIHHKNGNRSDNRLDNLQLRHGPHGIGQALICRNCGSHDIVPDDLG